MRRSNCHSHRSHLSLCLSQRAVHQHLSVMESPRPNAAATADPSIVKYVVWPPSSTTNERVARVESVWCCCVRVASRARVLLLLLSSFAAYVAARACVWRTPSCPGPHTTLTLVLPPHPPPQTHTQGTPTSQRPPGQARSAIAAEMTRSSPTRRSRWRGSRSAPGGDRTHRDTSGRGSTSRVWRRRTPSRGTTGRTTRLRGSSPSCRRPRR